VALGSLAPAVTTAAPVPTAAASATTVAAVPSATTVAPATPTTTPASATSIPAVPLAVVAPPLPVPVSVSIPAIKVNAVVAPVDLQPGTNVIEVPEIDKVGWWELGPRPGEDGSSLLVGHVDGSGKPGVFWRLRQLVPGDLVSIGYADGSTRSFRVSGRAQLSKQALPPDLFSREGAARLTIITCGGSFNRVTGHYVDNVVVVAEPVS
jgi:hypothetical protein